MKRNTQLTKPGLRVAGLLTLSLVCSAAMAQEALSVDPAGNIGVGTEAPAKQLHVVGSDPAAGGQNNVMLRVENASATPATRRMLELVNNGSPLLIFRDTERNEDWSLNPIGNRFTIGASGTGVQEMQIRTDGRVEFRSAALGPTATTMLITSAGNVTVHGSLTANGVVNMSSDVNSKREIEQVAADQVLAKLAALPVSTWEYKADEQGVKHLGPMAQDFHAAFGLGDDPTKLAPGDLAGVAVAAIQAQQQQIAELHQANAELRTQIQQMQDAVHKVSLQLDAQQVRAQPLQTVFAD